MQIEKAKIIYVMDPQCGWCYGNSENITYLKETFESEFDFQLYTGGMWIGQNAPRGGAGFSNFLETHAPRMVATTGAKVEVAYFDRARDPQYAFSSLEPSAAIVAIKHLAPDRVFDFSKAVQRALFVEGKRLDQVETYLPIVEKLAIDANSFKSVWMTSQNIQEASDEFDQAHTLATGFPTLLMESQGTLKVLASGYFDRNAMKKKLEGLLVK